MAIALTSPAAVLACALGIWTWALPLGAAPDDRASREAVQSLKAYAAFKAGNYADARERWLALAEVGNTTAMINLANMHEQGQGGETDLEAAAAWLLRAAERGDPRAQVELGRAYEKGRGVPRDPFRAMRWMREAAEQDDRDGQFSLGVMLATDYALAPGEDAAARQAEAVLWLQRAADGGHLEAQSFLEVLR